MHIRFQNLNDWYSYNSVFYSYKSMNNIIGFHLKSEVVIKKWTHKKCDSLFYYNFINFTTLEFFILNIK